MPNTAESPSRLPNADSNQDGFRTPEGTSENNCPNAPRVQRVQRAQRVDPVCTGQIDIVGLLNGLNLLDCPNGLDRELNTSVRRNLFGDDNSLLDHFRHTRGSPTTPSPQ